jgi:ribonuclease HI
MDGRDSATLRGLEESLWRPQTRFDREYLEQILAPDFVEHGRSGRRYARQDVVDTMPVEFAARLPLPDFEVREIADDVALVTYRSEVRYGENLETANRCSIWRRSSGGWVLEFHQGTPVG